MSTLKELLKKHCPDGVEYIKLEDFCSFTAGGDVPKNNFSKEKTTKYNIPIISNGIGANALYGYTNIIKIDEPCISISARGTIGHCIYHEKPFYPIVRLICIIPNDICIPKFLKYFFDNITIDVPKTGIPQLTIPMIKKIYVPVPPIEVQKEIVRILDTFTKYQDLLNRELELRKKQYEYYNNKLLTFNDNVEYKTLEELCDIVDYRGKTPKKVNSGIFLITAKNIRKGYIDYEKSKEYVDINDYPNIMHRGLPQIGDVLITTEAPLGYVAQIDRENVALAQRVIKYRPKDKSLLSSYYLKYILLGKEFQDKLLINATGGTVKGIKGSKLHKLTIPVPPLEEQERIVNILDKFDALCNDITRGLPAEIELRKKQYEYYRDKLLTFKEKK